MFLFGNAAKRARRGFAMTQPSSRRRKRVMTGCGKDRPGEIAFSPEREAEADERKARAKSEELAKANRNRCLGG